jgi:hypothetical protein
LAVPVLLVAGFLGSTQLARSLTTPPAHIAYFAISDYQEEKDAPNHLDIEAKETKIITSVKPNTPPKDSTYQPPARTSVVLAFDAAANTLTEIKIKRPEGITDGTFDAPELKDVTLSGNAVSPDGYQVVYRGYGSTIATDIFIGGRSNGYRISKNGASYKLPDPSDKPGTPYYRYYYNDIRFLGWSAQPIAAGAKQ